MSGTGIHHIYVETRSWDASVTFWEALGYKAQAGWGSQGDGILACEAGGPYIFLREVSDPHHTLAFDLVFGAPDLDALAADDRLEVARAPYEQPWGPRFMDVRTPDGQVVMVRTHAKA